MKLERSTYEILQILSIFLTEKTCLKELFEKTNFNDVKELNSSPFRDCLININCFDFNGTLIKYFIEIFPRYCNFASYWKK